jgi:hypothetical protein
MIAVPRIARGRERQVEARPADRELVGGELAEQHCAARRELRDGRAVFLRHVVDHQLRVAGGADAGGFVDVLERMRDAVQRALVDAGLEFAVGAVGVGKRALPCDQQEGVEQRIERGDAVERMPGERGRGERAGTQARARFGDRKFVQRLFRGHDRAPVGLRL